MAGDPLRGHARTRPVDSLARTSRTVVARRAPQPRHREERSDVAISVGGPGVGQDGRRGSVRRLPRPLAGPRNDGVASTVIARSAATWRSPRAAPALARTDGGSARRLPRPLRGLAMTGLRAPSSRGAKRRGDLRGRPRRWPGRTSGFRPEVATAPCGASQRRGCEHRHREERSDAAISVGGPDAGSGHTGPGLRHWRVT